MKTSNMTHANLPDNVRRELLAAAQRFHVTKLILFGSRARGTNRERSDVDLAVCGGDVDGFAEWLEEDIPSLLSFDLVDLDGRVSEELRMDLQNEGIVLYEEAGES